jgi:flagellar hook protein FlgE
MRKSNRSIHRIGSSTTTGCEGERRRAGCRANVNLEESLVGAIQDRAMFLANLAVIRTADEMTGALLDDEALV